MAGDHGADAHQFTLDDALASEGVEQGLEFVAVPRTDTHELERQVDDDVHVDDDHCVVAGHVVSFRAEAPVSGFVPFGHAHDRRRSRASSQGPVSSWGAPPPTRASTGRG